MLRSSLIVGYALVAAIVVLVLSGILGWRAAQSSVAASEAIARNKDTLLNLDRTLSAVRDAESGQRGYLLTGRDSYLQPYNGAVADLPSRLSQLRASVSGDAATGREIDRLQAAIAAKIEELASTIQLQQRQGHADAMAQVLTDRGAQLMAAVVEQIAQLQAEQTKLFESEFQQLSAARVRVAVSVFAVRFLTIALLITLVVVVRRETRHLRLSEARLAITLRSIGDAVIATDAEGQVVLMNTVAEELTGWSSMRARGAALDRVFRIVDEAHREPVESPVLRVMREGREGREGRVVGVGNHTLLLRRGGGEVPIEDSAAPIRDNSGAIIGVVLVFRDATAERQMGRALLEADQKKDEFIAVLAHELRNPLAPILQAVQIARQPSATREQLRWSLDVIERQGRAMGHLLDDLLDVSRITRGTVEINKSRVTLSEVVDGAVETARPLIEQRSHSLVLEVPPQAVTIEADPLRISQVIANLLTNAAKYTQPGGVLRLSVSVEEAQLTLHVSDNGIGIDPQALPRVFDMFVQVKGPLERQEGGLGIGLAVSKKLVELHGGTIEARSEGTGRGSEFIVRMPCVIGSTEMPAPAPARSPGMKRARLRVVVADDNRDAADSLSVLLQLDGHEVSVAHDGVRALELIKQVRPQVALLDIGMPGLNGYQVAEQARANAASSHMMLIALTGWGQAQDLQRANAAGFDHHLVKPAEPGAVRALLQTQSSDS
jgi:PAS domain S-box-containing protein